MEPSNVTRLNKLKNHLLPQPQTLSLQDCSSNTKDGKTPPQVLSLSTLSIHADKYEKMAQKEVDVAPPIHMTTTYRQTGEFEYVYSPQKANHDNTTCTSLDNAPVILCPPRI